MSPQSKQAVLAEVARWLDALDAEELPPELDPRAADEQAPVADLFALAASLAQISREVQLQGRAVKRLADGLERCTAPAPSTAADLDDLFGIYDALCRAVDEGRSSLGRLPAPARWFGAATLVEGLLHGLALTRDRVEQTLARQGVTPIASDGQAFDPESMRAIDVAPAGHGAPAGQVLATIRRGFRRGGQVLRPADVRVAGDKRN